VFGEHMWLALPPTCNFRVTDVVIDNTQPPSEESFPTGVLGNKSGAADFQALVMVAGRNSTPHRTAENA